MNEALHSEVKTWQKYFGLNDVYDGAFWLSTLEKYETREILV
jgi:hypothetical protein